MGYYQLSASLIVILLYLGVHRTNADIYCYKCTPVDNPQINNTDKLCSNFNQSEEYETYCQYSSFCLKKITELPLQHGQNVIIEERGCADQRIMTHKYDGKKWVKEDIIDENAYKEGCIISDPEGILKVAKTKYCYCSSNYCNSSQRTSESSFFHYTDTMSVIFIFNVVKLMRTIR